MHLLRDGLYVFSTGLLVPCIVALLLCLLQALYEGGRMLMERRRGRITPEALCEWVGEQNSAPQSLPPQLQGARCKAVTEALLGADSAARARYWLAPIRDRRRPQTRALWAPRQAGACARPDRYFNSHGAGVAGAGYRRSGAAVHTDAGGIYHNGCRTVGGSDWIFTLPTGAQADICGDICSGIYFTDEI